MKFRIAWRYLFARKSHSAVNIVSMVSMVGVALAVAAMIIVMSVFNGFHTFTSEKITHLEPDLTLLPTSGKKIDNADSIARIIAGLNVVASAHPVIEERCFAIHGQTQTPLTLHGISPNGGMIERLEPYIVQGETYIEDAALTSTDEPSFAILSIGAASQLSSPTQSSPVIKIYEPRRNKRITPANPIRAFVADSVIATGVVKTDLETIDADAIFIPFSMAQRLLNYTHEASYIEITMHPGVTESQAIKAITPLLPHYVALQTPLQRHDEAFKMIKIEKWVTTAMLTFILIIAAFNILSTMALLIAEKRSNISVMRTLGASKNLIAGIFSRLGILITLFGTVTGLIFGSIITLVQQHFHIIKMQVDNPAALTIDYYPVDLSVADTASIFAISCIVAFLTGLISSSAARHTLR